MDKLAFYIQQGSPLKKRFVCLTFCVFALISGCLMSLLLTSFFHQPEVQSYIQNVPAIEIRDGQIQLPQDTRWEKVIPGTDIKVFLDTTKDEISSFQEKTAFYLSRKNYYFVLNGAIQQSPYPTEDINLSPEKIQIIFPKIIRKCAFIFALFVFVFLWIGYGLVGLLTHLFLWVLQKRVSKDVLNRASFVGWICIIVLGFVLGLAGYHFSFGSGILLATVIALLASIRTN